MEKKYIYSLIPHEIKTQEPTNSHKAKFVHNDSCTFMRALDKTLNPQFHT